MSNIKRGFVPLELGGINLQLRFGNNELAELEDIMGLPSHDILQDLASHALSRRFLRAGLYAAISHDRRFGAGRRRDVALTKIGKMLDKCAEDDEGLVPVMNALVKAFFAAFGVDMDAIEADDAATEGADGPLEKSQSSTPSTGTSGGSEPMPAG